MSDAEVAWWSHGRGVYIFSHTWDGFNRASELAAQNSTLPKSPSR
jgi:hypothetical protein